MSDVFGVDKPSEFIEFEDQVHIDKNTGFIDGYIPTTKVLIEQKSIDKDLRKGIRQSDGSLLNPFQQAKKYIAELPLSKHPKYVITCNFKSFLVYNMENPNSEPEEILLENLEKEYYRLQFLVKTGNEHLKREMEISIQAGELVGKLYDEILKLLPLLDDSGYFTIENNYDGNFAKANISDIQNLAQKYFEKNIDINKISEKIENNSISVEVESGYGIVNYELVSVSKKDDNEYSIKFKYIDENTYIYTITVKDTDSNIVYISLEK